MLSAAALGYEILLTRLFSIIQWHHFAWMIISLALLGFGASGTLLALTRRWWAPRAAWVFVVALVTFGVTAVGCFALAQRLPFNALELLWDPWQPAWLLALYGLLLVPFTAAASGICLAFMVWPADITRVYGADLLGAGLGAAAVVGLLFLAPPGQVLAWIGAGGLLAAALAVLRLGMGLRLGLVLALAAVFVGLWDVEPRPSPFKALRQAQAVAGARVVDRRSSPLGTLTTVASPEVPFRHAPGLSLAAPGTPPEQLAVFTDADAPSMITRRAEADLGYLAFTSSALPLMLLDRPRVLVLGAGGGAEVLQALAMGAARVDAVELNPQMVRLVEETFADFSGRPYADARVRLHIDEARGFAAASDAHWELVQVALLDAFSTSSAGLHALSENYLYTVEALGEFLDHLAPGGLLSVTRWLKLPPRDNVKLFATAIAALRARGVDTPGAHLALIRSWNTATLIVGNEPLTPEQITAIREFCASRWFDMAWLPGLHAGEANRHNQWQRPWLYEAASALLGPTPEAFIDAYKFNVRPATDDRPHFFRFFRWRSLPEFLALRGQGGLPLLEQGYLVLVATFIQVVGLSGLLVLLPLWLNARKSGPGEQLGRRATGYFGLVGLGFLMIEIAFIQKFILYLSHPLYAVAVVLAGFLVFAGCGSLAAGRLGYRSGNRHGQGRLIRKAIGGIALMSMLSLLLLPWITAHLAALGDVARVALSLVLIAPLAFCMGMPFPLALTAVPGDALAWAWGVNGCASVVSAALAALLAIHLGFTGVVLIGMGCYALAAWLAPGTDQSTHNVRKL